MLSYRTASVGVLLCSQLGSLREEDADPQWRIEIDHDILEVDGTRLESQENTGNLSRGVLQVPDGFSSGKTLSASPRYT